MAGKVAATEIVGQANPEKEGGDSIREEKKEMGELE